MDIYNSTLNRETIKNDLIEKINYFENNKTLKTIKRGFYITGSNGIGKTTFVKNLLKELNYDVIHFSACDVRNKSIIESLTMSNMSDTNIISMFKKKKKKIAILMDEIDGLNSGDKGGVAGLISVIRPKKTKKQMIEPISSNPIFCISTHEIDKKTKELIKVCNHYNFDKPTNNQMQMLIEKIFPTLSKRNKTLVLEYSQNDLRKLNSLNNIYIKNPEELEKILCNDVFVKKSVIEISKEIVRTIVKKNIPINMHNIYINENERTIVALLWHENICDILFNINNNSNNLIFYEKILENLCYGDYIDRITFQKQIWQFNELSSFIKIMYNNYLMHQIFRDKVTIKKNYDIRFTKVLTKYSTEFNNYCFFQLISNKMFLDKKDIITYFLYLQNNDCKLEEEVTLNYDIKELDINRIYRYIDNHIN